MTLRWKHLPFQVRFEAWHLSRARCWWLVLHIMTVLGPLNRKAECSNPLKLAQMAVELSKKGFLQREGIKGSLLLSFKIGATMLCTFGFSIPVRCYVIIWQSRQVDRVSLIPQVVLVIVTKCLAQMAVPVLFTMEWRVAMKLGKDSETTQCHASWTARRKLIKCLRQVWSDFKVSGFSFKLWLIVPVTAFYWKATNGLY